MKRSKELWSMQQFQRGVMIGLDLEAAERSLAGRGRDAQLILNEAAEFVRQVAAKVVAEIKGGLKAGDPFPAPVSE